MAPPHQGLATCDVTAGEIDDRLVVEHEFAGRDGAPQVDLDLAPRLDRLLELVAIEDAGSPARCLGAVERNIGILEQVVRLGAMLGRERDADARTDRNRMS